MKPVNLGQSCSVPSCGQPARTRLLCGAHYFRWLRTGQTGPAQRLRGDTGGSCRIAGCGQPVRCRRLCERHYDEVRRSRPCPGCGARMDNRSRHCRACSPSRAKARTSK